MNVDRLKIPLKILDFKKTKKTNGLKGKKRQYFRAYSTYGYSKLSIVDPLILDWR